MDPKAPRIATASLVLGAITWILAVVSFTLNLGLEDGYGNEEVLLTVIAVSYTHLTLPTKRIV